MECSTVITSCPQCKSKIEINRCWTPGGINDSGGFILKCSSCGYVFDKYIGKDINDSRVVSGATVLDTYDNEVGDHDIAKARHGLTN